MMTDLLEILLTKRGITDPVAREAFLNPDYDLHIHDPLDEKNGLKDVRRAAERLIKAIKEKETIAIFSDYDADGIPGAAMFADFLSRAKAENFITYIPDRHEEGFGLSVEAIEELADRGAKLIISIDCGITDLLPAARARELGIDLIITDHHIPGSVLPDAFAIVNPKQADCEYPEKMLCGSGVAFKLIQAVLGIDRLDIKEGHEKWLLDMVGIATLSDMVPLLGENRIFASYGLQVLKKTARVGLVRLLSEVGVKQKTINEDDVAFMVTPRINAASRMGSAHDAFELLSTVDEVRAGVLVNHLQKLNDERKGVVASIVKEAKKHVEKNGPQKVIVLGDPSWRPSLLGLVANSLAEEFHCPVFLWGREGGKVIKGSCRSDGTVSVVDIMQSVPAGTFIDSGGHHMAGGFSVEFDKVHFLHSIIETAYLAAAFKPRPLDAVADAELSIDDVNERTWGAIEKCAPFGFGNPKPVFIFRNALVKSAKEFGKLKNHFEVVFEKTNGATVKAIAFFCTAEDFADVGPLVPGTRVDLLANIEKSFFMNRPELRLRIIDIMKR